LIRASAAAPRWSTVPVGAVVVVLATLDLGRVPAALAPPSVVEVGAGGASAAVATPPTGAGASAAKLSAAASAPGPAASGGAGTWVKVTGRGLAG
jgi:hypothetical protein